MLLKISYCCRPPLIQHHCRPAAILHKAAAALAALAKVSCVGGNPYSLSFGSEKRSLSLTSLCLDQPVLFKSFLYVTYHVAKLGTSSLQRSAIGSAL
jgi:hypothetical protein